MNIMKKAVRKTIVENTIKFCDKQMNGFSTRDCMLIILDEPEMPKELIEEQLKQRNNIMKMELQK